jgi:hypothetical protein
MRLVWGGILFLLLFSTISYAAAVGISPARLEFANVLRAGYAEKTFTVSTDSEEPLFGHLEATGAIKDWIHFPENISTFNATSASPARITMIIMPPSDTPLGRYAGQLIAVGDSVGSLSGRAGSVIQTSVAMSLSAEITGEEIRNCKAGAFQFQDAERGKPLELWATVENSGNVRISPLVSYELSDQQRENDIESRELQSPEILPTQSRRFFLQSPNTLETGQYWVTIKMPECNSEGLVTFSVVEKGEIADQGNLVELRIQQEANTYETVPVTASFINKGQRVVTAYFKGTAKLNGKIVGVIESEKLDVAPGKNAELQALFTPQKPGKYEITGRVAYNQKLTFEKSINLQVSEEKKAAEFPIALVAYAAFVAGAFFLVRELRKRKAK